MKRWLIIIISCTCEPRGRWHTVGNLRNAGFLFSFFLNFWGVLKEVIYGSLMVCKMKQMVKKWCSGKTKIKSSCVEWCDQQVNSEIVHGHKICVSQSVAKLLHTWILIYGKLLHQCVVLYFGRGGRGKRKDLYTSLHQSICKKIST